jgi:putative heme-binding domain-containing protein
VSPTEPLDPDEQAKQFKLPPGFGIQLVASEPQIQKPMNMAFDARGRLWVTHSTEYPFAAKEDAEPRDGVTVLEGIGRDGRAAKATRFANRLNIPIGVLPLGDGHEAIVWSIPYIWKLTDRDRDGVADEREILYGPFDFVDTHGNQNAFRMGLDGWIYACHGFRNNSQIRLRGKGEVVLTLNSGNTYRFRPDGSAIEQVSWGQVNPFGSCFDPWGNFYTADCHSKPLTMVLRGGVYESFGKPHDGLGFAPIATRHDHGSTGIAGVAYYSAEQFPAEYRDCLYVGNVITNVIHRDVPKWTGSTPWVEQPDDFVSCEDWWFHPVDLQIGPDGALYIADFYNCIIGHYEVDLQHPRRDRHRGRIWRVVWQEGSTPNGMLPDLTAADRDELVRRLDDANFAVRCQATQELCRRFGRDSVEAVTGVRTPRQRAHAVWIRQRHDELKLDDPAGSSADRLDRLHFVRAWSENGHWNSEQQRHFRGMLADSDPMVRRAVVEGLGRHSALENVAALLACWSSITEDDQQLVHAIKIALRNQLRDLPDSQPLLRQNWSREDIARLAAISLAVPRESAASLAFEFARDPSLDVDLIARCLLHTVRFVGESKLESVAAFARDRYANDLPRQVALFQSLFDGLAQRGLRLQRDSQAGRWGEALAARLLDPSQRAAMGWSNHPLDVTATNAVASPWGVRTRNTTDGESISVFDSIVNGEQLTGVLRSAPFEIPLQLTFWMCGHNGQPGTDPSPLNHIRLRLVADDGALGEVIARDLPPRNDVAHAYHWKLDRWKGRRGVIEIVDGDTGSAYAWIAAGRFAPSIVSGPEEGLANAAAPLILAIRTAEQLKLSALLPSITAIVADRNGESTLRTAAISAAMALNRDSSAPLCLAIVASLDEPLPLRVAAALLLGPLDSDDARAGLAAALPGAPPRLEQALALALASSTAGAELLLGAIEGGKATPRLLQDSAVVDRLKNARIPDPEQRILAITSQLPPADDAIRRLVAQRINGYPRAKTNVESGAALFKKHCAACHKLGNEGTKIGPQLDGIGQRGHERLLEDLLDPSRHLDAAFRATIVTTTNGLVVSGLKLREEGQIIVLADNQGKEVRIPVGDIDEARLSSLSPMPSNFGEQIPEPELYNLIAFLLRQQTAPP